VSATYGVAAAPPPPALAPRSPTTGVCVAGERFTNALYEPGLVGDSGKSAVTTDMTDQGRRVLSAVHVKVNMITKMRLFSKTPP
jgi:hypothetical protein